MFVAREINAADRTHGSFPLFDWLRFVLASVVALTHEGAIAWENAGNFAVQIFFALSGWLIGGILLRTEMKQLPRFYYNRATRIWIPYLFAVITIYGLSALREPLTSAYFRFLFYDLTFTHNWFVDVIPRVVSTMPLKGTGTHFWSISVEEQFYLAAPLLLFLPRVGRSVAFWVAIAAAAILAHSWYGSISLGVLCAVVREHWGDWQISKIGVAFCSATALLCAALLVLAPPTYWWAAPPLACCIVLLTSRTGRRTELGNFVGAVSYPLYLYHWVGAFGAHVIVRQVPLPMPLIAYPIAVVAGVAAYLLVDRNVMRWRAASYRPAYGRALLATAYSLLAVGIIGGELLS